MQQCNHIERTEIKPPDLVTTSINRTKRCASILRKPKPSRASRQARITHLQFSKAIIA